MFGLKDYVAVTTPEQAWQLLQADKNNVILGGLLWMKMGKKQYHTGIDLKNLGLDRIIEKPQCIEVGAMTSLRQMETSPVLAKWFGHIFPQGLKAIVGIQFRNLATVGGSVYARFGFSDVITSLLCLETQVHLYDRGKISLKEFLSMPTKKDILLKVEIPKESRASSYQSIRKSATDFPVLSLAASRCRSTWTISIGARPQRACLAPETAALLPDTPDDAQIETACDTLVREVGFGTDQRGSKEYRQALSKVLLKRGITQICR